MKKELVWALPDISTNTLFVSVSSSSTTFIILVYIMFFADQYAC